MNHIDFVDMMVKGKKGGNNEKSADSNGEETEGETEKGREERASRQDHQGADQRPAAGDDEDKQTAAKLV